MAKRKYAGDFNFSGNLEVAKTAPLDARIVVNSVAELILPETWLDEKGGIWLYDGIVVSVVESGKYGLYMLQNYDPTTAAEAYKTATNWVRLDGGALSGDVASKVASVTATPNKGIEIGGTATAPTVGIKIDETTPGNVTLTTGANGLKGQVTIPVTSVASKSKGIEVDPTTGDVKVGLKLNNATGTNKTSFPVTLTETETGLLATVNLSSFSTTAELPKDLVVDSGSVVGGTWNQDTFTEGTGTGKALKLHIKNAESGQEYLYINVADLVDVYKEGVGINISEDNTVSVELASDNENAFLSVGATGLKLSGVQAAIDKAKGEAIAAVDPGVTTIDSKKGAFTVKSGSTTNGDINLAVSGSNEISASIVGLKSAAYKEDSYFATAAALEEVKGKSDTALQSIGKGTDGTYVTTTVSAKGSGTTLNVSVALTYGNFTDTNGVAKTEDVKTYVDSALEWQEME